MSAPLVVNTTDGTVWTRREATRDGLALYAPEKCGSCPQFVMATYAELEGHGIAGAADVLPMPAGPAQSEREQLRAAFVTALDNAHQTHPCPATGRPYWVGCVHYNDAGRVVGVGSCHSERRADAVLAVRDAEVERLRARVAELETERHSTNEALDDAVQELRARQTGPALPWAHAMPDDDLHEFLGDLVSAAMGRWRSEPEVPDRTVLADIEKVCADWRTPGEGLRSDPEPEPAPDAVTRVFAPVASLREPEPEFHAYLHHPYQREHDMPETGGVSATEPADVCRCDEPDVDPYECEADDCTAEFSELNPFGGGGPVEGHDAKVSRVCGCGWRTSVWHVNDGSAEEELHGHVVRLHGGAYPARAGGA